MKNHLALILYILIAASCSSELKGKNINIIVPDLHASGIVPPKLYFFEVNQKDNLQNVFVVNDQKLSAEISTAIAAFRGTLIKKEVKNLTLVFEDTVASTDDVILIENLIEENGQVSIVNYFIIAKSKIIKDHSPSKTSSIYENIYKAGYAAEKRHGVDVISISKLDGFKKQTVNAVTFLAE